MAESRAQPGKKLKRSIWYVGFDIFCAIGDLLDDILNPIFKSISTLPKETSEVIGPVIVSVVSVLNNSKGLYENYCKFIKYSKIKPEEQKQRSVKLNTAGIMGALSLTGIVAGSLYFISVVTPGLSMALPFLEPLLPLLPGILPGIGFAISACYLIRKAYVYHQSKNHNLSAEDQKKARNKMLLAVMGAVGQMVLFAGMMTMVALTGGAPVIAGAILGASTVTLQKVVKWCVLKRAKACDNQALSAPATPSDQPLSLPQQQESVPSPLAPVNVPQSSMTSCPSVDVPLVNSTIAPTTCVSQPVIDPHLSGSSSPAGAVVRMNHILRTFLPSVNNESSATISSTQREKKSNVMPLTPRPADFSSVPSSSSSFFYNNATGKIPMTSFDREDRLIAKEKLAPRLSI